MREVSWRSTSLLLQIAAREGLDVGALVADLQVSEDALAGGPGRFDWDLWVELVERLERMVGADKLERFGALANEAGGRHPFKAVARLVSSPERLYQLNARWGAPAAFRHLRATCKPIAGGRLRVALEMDGAYRGSSAAFTLSAGVLRGLPRLIGLPESEVSDVEVGSHRVSMVVEPPPSATLWSRAKRAADAASGFRTAIEQLGEQERELGESHQRWRALAENALGFIFILDRRGVIEEANHPFCGRTPRQLEGTELAAFASERDRPRLVAALAEVLQQGSIVDLEIQGPACGAGEWYACRVGPIRAEGEVARVSAMLTDVTEKKRTELALSERDQQLRQAQKMEAIGLLAGGVAHDFNNLLTVIRGFADVLLAKGPSDPFTTQGLTEISRAGARATELTRQLLAFSSRQLMTPVVLDVNEIILGLEGMLALLLGEQVQLVLRLSPELWSSKLDPAQVEQVVVNLAINARDAFDGGGTFTIDTRNVELDVEYARAHLGAAPGPHILLSFSDDGGGMDEETLARVFEPFFTTKGRGKGTGLGLATVRGIVQQSGGHIALRSAPGEGATFEIYFPRAAEAAPPAVEISGATQVARGAETILLVEDDPQVRALARQVLESAGYRVLAAASAEEAIDLSRTREIELLVTDLVMPGMNGRDLAVELRARFPGLGVLFVSGYATDEIMERGFLDSDPNLLPKPFSPEALASRVRETLDGTRWGLRANQG